MSRVSETADPPRETLFRLFGLSLSFSSPAIGFSCSSDIGLGCSSR
ncbi:hypothetical protein HID58_036460 [Brassica napus]|uniref:Uncharacterized protein n=1 Tax=Brassica napus TaxID=3708 RepID=A0ABQ8C7U6_BRANA|nr:hypothetical protein HID58_036460 [Brassica napus]